MHICYIKVVISMLKLQLLVIILFIWFIFKGVSRNMINVVQNKCLIIVTLSGLPFIFFLLEKDC